MVQGTWLGRVAASPCVAGLHSVLLILVGCTPSKYALGMKMCLGGTSMPGRQVAAGLAVTLVCISGIIG